MDVKVDGRRVFVHDGGIWFDPARPVVALIHGAGADHTIWRYHSRNLAHRGFGVLAPDLPGHGRSEGPVLTSISDMGEWLAELLGELGCESASLVGHSMGSLIALECAATHPDSVNKLALIGTSARMLVHPDLQAAADDANPLAVDLIVDWSNRGSRRLGGHPSSGTWAIASIRRTLEKSLGVSLGADLRACSRYLSKASAVNCPTLVIAGSADAMTPAQAGRALADVIPGANFCLLQGGGHNSLFTDPDPIRRVLEAFLGP